MKPLRIYNWLHEQKRRRIEVEQELDAEAGIDVATRAARQAGMTLLEILIVLAIIGLVFGLFIGPQLAKLFEGSREDVAKLAVRQLADDGYIKWGLKNNKRCPDSLQELSEFVATNLKDPWGADYVMHCGDSAPPNKRFGVSSPGPDSQPGTDDDIKSWDIQ